MQKCNFTGVKSCRSVILRENYPEKCDLAEMRFRRNAGVNLVGSQSSETEQGRSAPVGV